MLFQLTCLKRLVQLRKNSYTIVLTRGVEPLRPCGHQILSLAWLPLHHVSVSTKEEKIDAFALVLPYLDVLAVVWVTQPMVGKANKRKTKLKKTFT